MVGLKVGLEIHQRLNTNKLFCNCPSRIIEREPDEWIIRKMGVSYSELGSIDPAARFEVLRDRKFFYGIYYDETCEVEADESPPLPMNEKALEIALKIAEIFNMVPLDEIHVMRKIVVDGSNTTGFQRTALVAVGDDESYIETSKGRVRIRTLCLEEESAYIVESRQEFAKYKLDRLGIPLVEIATAPDIHDPDQAREAALKIGRMLRATGEVMRGIGTIRQDINISIEGGARQEIKGVQELDLIPEVIRREVQRQRSLLDIKEELRRRSLSEDELDESFTDVTPEISESGSKMFRKALSSGNVALAVKLPKMRGLLGREIQPGRRFGTELASYAKVFGGVRGIIHSDELPGYGIGTDEVSSIASKLGLGEEDAFAIVVAERGSAEIALGAVLRRAHMALEGVPEETRRALPDGNTEFMRPMPGSARMYPETDIPPVNPEPILRRLASWRYESPEEIVGRLMRNYGLSREQADMLFDEQKVGVFERIASSCRSLSKRFVADVLTSKMRYLRREGLPVDSIHEEVLEKVLLLVDKGVLAKEAVESLLADLSLNPKADIEELVRSKYSMDKEALAKIVEEAIEKYRDLLKEDKDRALKKMIGEVMRQVRGKVDGRRVRDLVVERIESEA